LGVHIAFGGRVGVAVSYSWEPSVGGWVRSQAGTAHLDESGEQVAPQNVVVQFVEYVSTGIRDAAGTVVREPHLVGAGAAWVFTEGQLVRGRWERGGVGEVTRYLDEAGQPIAFSPGRTWVALARPGSATVLGAPAPP
jgi:hypothetical protein